MQKGNWNRGQNFINLNLISGLDLVKGISQLSQAVLNEKYCFELPQGKANHNLYILGFVHAYLCTFLSNIFASCPCLCTWSYQYFSLFCRTDLIPFITKSLYFAFFSALTKMLRNVWTHNLAHRCDLFPALTVKLQRNNDAVFR